MKPLMVQFHTMLRSNGRKDGTVPISIPSTSKIPDPLNDNVCPGAVWWTTGRLISHSWLDHSIAAQPLGRLMGWEKVAIGLASNSCTWKRLGQNWIETLKNKGEFSLFLQRVTSAPKCFRGSPHLPLHNSVYFLSKGSIFSLRNVRFLFIICPAGFCAG